MELTKIQWPSSIIPRIPHPDCLFLTIVQPAQILLWLLDIGYQQQKRTGTSPF